MSFLDGATGRKLFEDYLKKFDGGSQRVYRSEIQQFFDFKDSDLSGISKDTLNSYREKIGKEHTPKTTKRKFSMLNGFFKFLEKKVKGFQNPIDTLKEFKTHKGIESEDLKKYLEGFIASQNTANTKRSYENLVRLFFVWAGKDLMEVSRMDTLAYRDHLREDSNKDTTIWNKFIALNRFFKYIEKENRKFKNPIVFKELKLIFPKKDKGYYSVLSTAEAERLLKLPNRRTAIGQRDYAMLLILLVYGLRANEIVKLRHKNLEQERIKGQQKVWITDRKGRFQNRPKTAIILNGRALQAFDDWIETVNRSGVKVTGELPVFLPFIYDQYAHGLVIRRDRQDIPLSVKAIEDVVKKYIVKAKIKREGGTLSPHALRHTAFTVLAQEGVRLQDIQKLAGHQDINTTMIYVHSAQSYEDHPGMHSPLNK
ncbi:MAG: tyrosine-type recombinase/integrase [Deltaproteobacteria bacterium]|nr:tyrosine-type recombinase/integrase [Deltaproteobacteria bacterium]